MNKYFLCFLVCIFSARLGAQINHQIYQPDPEKQSESFKLGIEVLEENHFDLLAGKRIGLVTNPTGVNSKLKSTVDILSESEKLNMVALFGPEHGVRGNFSAGDLIENQKDAKTGIPVYSLYGKNRKPDSTALSNVDVLVYDIQDIGVRSYTYISTMAKVMEAAAEFNKEVIILDRPNPLGGKRIEGPLVEEGFFSFVSQFSIPYIYGLTCGELAILLNEEGLLENGKKCSLEVVRMKGWNRNMIFGETGLSWVPSSPHIPDWIYPSFSNPGHRKYGCIGIIKINECLKSSRGDFQTHILKTLLYA